MKPTTTGFVTLALLIAAASTAFASKRPVTEVEIDALVRSAVTSQIQSLLVEPLAQPVTAYRSDYTVTGAITGRANHVQASSYGSGTFSDSDGTRFQLILDPEFKLSQHNWATWLFRTNSADGQSCISQRVTSPAIMGGEVGYSEKVCGSSHIDMTIQGRVQSDGNDPIVSLAHVKGTVEVRDLGAIYSFKSLFDPKFKFPADFIISGVPCRAPAEESLTASSNIWAQGNCLLNASKLQKEFTSLNIDGTLDVSKIPFGSDYESLAPIGDTKEITGSAHRYTFYVMRWHPTRVVLDENHNLVDFKYEWHLRTCSRGAGCFGDVAKDKPIINEP